MDSDKSFLFRIIGAALHRLTARNPLFRSHSQTGATVHAQHSAPTSWRSVSMVILGVSSSVFGAPVLIAQDNALRAPMGWSLAPLESPCDLNENRLRELFQSIKQSGLDRVGFRTIVLENCWQASPGETLKSVRESQSSETSSKPGSLPLPVLHDSSRFPQGLKNISQELRSQGYQLGVQFRLPSCFAVSKDATPGSSSQTSQPMEGTGLESTFDVQEREPLKPQLLVRALYDQGVEFVRIRSCIPSLKHRLNEYHAIGTAFKNAPQELGLADPEKLLPMTVSLHDPEVLGVEAWSMDPAALWTFDTKPASDWIGIFHQASLATRFSALSGKGHWNEPGPLWPPQSHAPSLAPSPSASSAPWHQGTLGWNFEQKKTQWQLWTMMGSPLFIPLTPENLSRETLKLASSPALLGIFQDHIGLQALPFRQNAQEEVWVKPLSRPGHRAVLLVNKTDRLLQVGLDPSVLGLQRPFFVGEVISQKVMEIPATQTYFDKELPPYGSLLVTVMGQERKPLSPVTPIDGDETGDSLAAKKDTPTMVSLTQKIPVYGAGLKPPSQPRRVSGIAYTQTLSVDAPSVVRFFLGGQCQKFQSLVGIEDDNPADTWMGFEVWADGMRVFTSKQLSPKNPVGSLAIKLDSVNYLDLVTLGGSSQLHIPTGQWIYPSILCQGPVQGSKSAKNESPLKI